MKRINGLFEKICTKDNIEYADDKASNDKKLRKDIIKHNEHRKEENEKLLNDLINLNYHTSTNKILYKIIINRTLPTTIKIWKSNNYLRQMNSL